MIEEFRPLGHPHPKKSCERIYIYVYYLIYLIFEYLNM